jgi:hypothetical protein
MRDTNGFVRYVTRCVYASLFFLFYLRFFFYIAAWKCNTVPSSFTFLLYLFFLLFTSTPSLTSYFRPSLLVVFLSQLLAS